MIKGRLATAGVIVLLAAAGGGAAVAVSSGADSGDAGAKGRATSYCEAAREVSWADPKDDESLGGRLDRALALAPPKVRPTIRAMQRSAGGSDAYAGAQATFTTFNTNHCCECIGTGEPVIAAVEPAPHR